MATAVYGDEDTAEVRSLRLLRDEVLVRYVAGRVFIRAYARLGPSAARAVERVPALRRLCRFGIDAFVRCIDWSARRRST